MLKLSNTKDFIKLAEDAIVDLEKDQYERDVNPANVQPVSIYYTAGSMKGTFVVAKNTQNRFYEVTYSATTDRIYIDEYTKTGTKVITL